MYTKEGWKPVTTELNDPCTHTHAYDRVGQIRSLAEPACYEGTGAGLKHSDWCEDLTCHCQRG